MEGFSNDESVSNVENLAEWRELRDKAPARAQELIEGIDGFAAMGHLEKVAALDTLFKELESDNKNRFVAKFVSLIRAEIFNLYERERENAAIQEAKMRFSVAA